MCLALKNIPAFLETFLAIAASVPPDWEFWPEPEPEPDCYDLAGTGTGTGTGLPS